MVDGDYGDGAYLLDDGALAFDECRHALDGDDM